MAKNRTEIFNLVDAWTAILDLETTHKPNVKEFITNAVFRKDVSSALSPVGSVTIDFTDIDYVEVTQTGNLDVTITGVSQGEFKFLKFDKSVGQEINIIGANNSNNSISNEFINVYAGEVYYFVFNKDGTTTNLFPISTQLQKSSTAEAQTGTNDITYLTPAKLQDVTATETRAGVAEIATTAEAQAGIDDTKTLTPAKLQDVTATTTRSGIQENADSAEAKNQSASNKTITPSNIFDIFNNWIDISYVSGNFTNWTGKQISSGNQNYSLRYLLVGKTVFIHGTIIGDVSSVQTSLFYNNLPSAITSIKNTSAVLNITGERFGNGTIVTLQCLIQNGDINIFNNTFPFELDVTSSFTNGNPGQFPADEYIFRISGTYEIN